MHASLKPEAAQSSHPPRFRPMLLVQAEFCVDLNCGRCGRKTFHQVNRTLLPCVNMSTPRVSRRAPLPLSSFVPYLAQNCVDTCMRKQGMANGRQTGFLCPVGRGKKVNKKGEESKEEECRGVIQSTHRRVAHKKKQPYVPPPVAPRLGPKVKQVGCLVNRWVLSCRELTFYLSHAVFSSSSMGPTHNPIPSAMTRLTLSSSFLPCLFRHLATRLPQRLLWLVWPLRI